MKKLGLVILFLIIINSFSNAQCSQFAFASGKWSISPELGAGAVVFKDFGKGWEVTYGAGIEWAPFKRLLYFNLNGRHGHLNLGDDSPDPDVFVDAPNKMEMYSTFFRVQVGIKLRFDWWFNKIDYEGFHPFIGLSYMHDEMLNEETKLTYGSTIVNSDDIFSTKQLSGEQYELGFSLVFNDNLKWDLSGYIYDQREYESILKNGISYIPNSKLGIGLSTGLYITF
jgi:hypothetical protein